MEIKAVVDRIENGYAILKPEGYVMEICIPANTTDKKYSRGENITLSINGDDENNG
uniref:hypothetical protein n=1 Tax=Acetivibrio cellulolyticus TaxID=35830 RepID=UPI0001E2D51C|nr:hypothetical protein [Acetivibrio cellulolyticus]